MEKSWFNKTSQEVEQELKDAFYELEDLIDKIKKNKADGELNMEKVDAHLAEYRKLIEHIISEKNTKEAKALVREIGQLDFDLRNAVTGNAMDAQVLKSINNDFGSIKWKNATKARQLINQGLQLANEGKTSSIRPILVQIISEMSDGEKLKETLR